MMDDYGYESIADFLENSSNGIQENLEVTIEPSVTAASTVPAAPPIAGSPFHIQESIGEENDNYNTIYKVLLFLFKQHDELAAQFHLFYYLRNKNPFDVNHRFPSENNDTLLMICAKYGMSVLTERFIYMDADVHARSKNNFTALHHAAVANDGLIIIKLIRAGVNLTAETSDRNTAIHLAAMHNSTAALLILRWYKNHINVNAKNKQGFTPLHVAIANGHEKAVKSLLEFPNIDISDWRPHIVTLLDQNKLQEATTIRKLLLEAEEAQKTDEPFILPPKPVPLSENAPELVEMPPEKRKLQTSILRLLKANPVTVQPPLKPIAGVLQQKPIATALQQKPIALPPKFKPTAVSLTPSEAPLIPKLVALPPKFVPGEEAMKSVEVSQQVTIAATPMKSTAVTQKVKPAAPPKPKSAAVQSRLRTFLTPRLQLMKTPATNNPTEPIEISSRDPSQEEKRRRFR